MSTPAYGPDMKDIPTGRDAFYQLRFVRPKICSAEHATLLALLERAILDVQGAEKLVVRASGWSLMPEELKALLMWWDDLGVRQPIDEHGQFRGYCLSYVCQTLNALSGGNALDPEKLREAMQPAIDAAWVAYDARIDYLEHLRAFQRATLLRVCSEGGRTKQRKWRKSRGPDLSTPLSATA